jgi:predicted small lipoprotein YifL
MKRSVLTLASISTLALSLAACGSGGGGTVTPNQTAPIQPPTTVSSTNRSVATLTMTIPRVQPSNVGPVTTSATKRSPQYLSPGTDKIAIMLDKKEIVTDQEVANFNNAGPSGNGTFTDPTTGSTFQISYDATNPAYYQVDVNITTTPGTHEFGVVIKSGTPAYVLSEGQGTYTLSPTPPGGTAQNLGQLLLKGVMASAYIECDTAAENTDTTGQCSNYANFTPATGGAFGGAYAFTAVAADYDGFPIVYQLTGSPATPASFDNGSYSVVETDAGSVVTITQTGAPFSNPGNHLTGPSSGYVPGTNFVYGNAFTVSCNKVGTANLALQLTSGTGAAPTTPIDGYTYGPGGNSGTGNGYTQSTGANAITNGGILPVGSKTTVSAGRSPQVNVTINCTADGTLQLI